MNILINISHPAHVHLFKYTITALSEKGHNIIVAARNKEFVIALLKAYAIPHILLTNQGKGASGLMLELCQQQIKLSKIIRENPIDIMLQMNGIFNAPVGRYYNIPTIALSDTENDKWANLISFSLTRHVLSPSCFDHSIGGTWKNQILYPGYHELAYLCPRYVPEAIQPEDRFLVRFVGWKAGHDIGEKGLSDAQKIEIVNILREFGTVSISSEAPLPAEIAKFSCKFHPAEVHDFMKRCKMVVGESATMASEAACLGIPAVFISNTGRGYTTEQDKKYGIIKHFRISQWLQIIKQIHEWASQDLKYEWQEKRWNMLKHKIDVTLWLSDFVDQYPQSILEAKKGNFEGYLIKNSLSSAFKSSPDRIACP